MKIPRLTHLNPSGIAQMVDVSHKSNTLRKAEAVGSILLGKEAFGLVKENKIKKGDVLSVANIAGIQGAKNTALLIPLCHQLNINKINLDFVLNDRDFSIKVISSVSCLGNTGVEMEAITAVTVACTTIYDMCKVLLKLKRELIEI